MKIHTLAALLALLPGIVSAQYTLSGKITSLETGETLPGAHIRLADNYRTAVSDRSGTYLLSGLKQGTVKVIASYIGYAADTVTIEIRKNTQLDIRLAPSAIMQGEVVIRSTRAGDNTPVAYESIGSAALEKINFGQDLPMLISGSISSVSTSDAGNGMGYTALRIRGTDMTRINVTINGIPLNDPESHTVFWVDLPDFAASTDNIQIQRGVGTSTNGASAFGASINLQSASLRTEPYLQLSLAAGSYSSYKNSIIFGSGIFRNHFSFDGRISQLSSAGYIDRASSSLLSWYFSGAYSAKKDLLRFNIFSGREKTYQAWDGIPSEILDTNRTYNGMGAYRDLGGFMHFYDNETDNYTQTHYQALYSHQFSDKLLLNLSAHHTTGAGYYEQYRDDDKLQDYGIDPVFTGSPFITVGPYTVETPGGFIAISDLIRQKHLANSFSGLTWSVNRQSKRFETSLGGSWNTYTGNHFGRVVWMQFAGSSAIGHEWYRSKSIKNDFNIYFKSQYAAGEKLSLWGDVQYRQVNYSLNGTDDDRRDITQSHLLRFFNPKAGITYRLNQAQRLFASFAVANREPNRDNYVDADPLQPMPRPETLFDTEAGYGYSSGWLALSTNLYYMYYADQLVLTGAINDVGAPVMVNVPRSYRLGLELAAKMMFTNNVNWESSLTLSRNRISSFTELIDDWDNRGQQEAVVHTGTDIAFSPALLANSRLNWNVNRAASISLISKYVGKQYIDNTQNNDRQLDAYLVNNLLLTYRMEPKFMQSVSISLMINNLMNEQYESNAWVYRYKYEGRYGKLDGYFPQAGINFMAGINLQF